MLTFYYGEGELLDEIQVGVDEAGRGCFAGPVVAAAVCWETNWLIENKYEYEEIGMIKDSKKLTAKQRHKCFEFIKKHAKSYGICFVSNIEIDSENILQSTFKAMHGALDKLECSFDRIIVDGNSFKSYINKHDSEDMFVIPHVCISKGDDTYFSIACASILAKVSRDNYIDDLCEKEPVYQEKYGWKNNKCYGTRKHIEAIRCYGITDLHRKTFGMCRNYA